VRQFRPRKASRTSLVTPNAKQYLTGSETARAGDRARAVDRPGGVMRELACWLAAAVLAAAPASARGAGDARAGEALYVGTARLANGGAPCLGCHGLAGHGLAWRASFGPDLSTVGEAYDAETIAGLLEDVPFPSMAPLYGAHPITAGERADLAAFLLASRAATGAEMPC
jgi:hypothetical protein